MRLYVLSSEQFIPNYSFNCSINVFGYYGDRQANLKVPFERAGMKIQFFLLALITEIVGRASAKGETLDKCRFLSCSTEVPPPPLIGTFELQFVITLYCDHQPCESTEKIAHTHISSNLYIKHYYWPEKSLRTTSREAKCILRDAP
jgi:hypothetical protein